ncbi:MAG: N-acetyltransferase family protein [Bacillota bacterium]
MEYTMREAEITDYEKLQDIHKEVHDFHVDGRPDIYKEADRTLDKQYFTQLIESDEGAIYLIENDNEIIGFTILRINESPNRTTIMKRKYLFMEDLGVKEQYRSYGLGRKLFQRAMKFAKENDAATLELGVWEFNEEAIHFYKSMGMNNQARKMEIRIE